MDKQKNLAVLKQYYAALVRSLGTTSYGSAYHYMVDVCDKELVDENTVDSKAILSLLAQLQDAGFGDLYLNGKRLIGIKYGVVPLELEIMFTLDSDDEVEGFRMELFLRVKKSFNNNVMDGTRLCGRWRWDKSCGLMAEVPLDIGKVLWGIKGR